MFSANSVIANRHSWRSRQTIIRRLPQSASRGPVVRHCWNARHPHHQYDRVEVDEIWGVIQDEVPQLLAMIEPLLPVQES